MKQLVTFFMLLLCISTSYCQGINGGLRINGFSNTDNKLASNVKISEAHILLISQKSNDTLLNELTKLEYRQYLPTGKYTMIATIDGYEKIIMEELIRAGDKITFIDLLFEPKQRKNFVPAVQKN